MTLTEPPAGYSRVSCGVCNGTGHVSNGFDPYPDECPRCWGNGHVYATPGGRLVIHPGGPFVGRLEKSALEGETP